MKKLLLLSLLILSQMIWSQTATAPASGAGTPGDPYLIATLDNLYWIAASTSRWSSHYRQTADIDAAATSGWFSGAGWLPIGNNSIFFTGSYNGDGHIISNLTINRQTISYIGLFGFSMGVAITNLGLPNVSIAGKYSAGAIVGVNVNTTISNCYSTGTISGIQELGGIAGDNYGTGTISNCYSTASVTGTYATVGGIAGYSEGTIVSCYSTGSESGPQYVGGLVGDNIGQIYNCYSTGNISGTITAGGLVGSNGVNGIVGNCYSRGNVSGTDYLGGLVGGNDGQIYNCYSTGSVIGFLGSVAGFVGSSPGSNLYVQGCFWDTQTSNQSESGLPYGIEGATGKTTYEMTTGALIVNFYIGAFWDFKGESVNGTDDIWNINNVRNDGYPFLSWQFPSDDPLPVELTSFTAKVNGSQVTLNWQTATEVNNYGFTVEKSESRPRRDRWMNGCMNEWREIGFVAGSGNSNSVKDYSFTDIINSSSIQPYSHSFRYRLKQIDNDGSFTYSKEIEIGNLRPSTFDLRQNFPNPFNPSTVISYQIPRDGYVTLKVYDMIGNEVATLVNGVQNSGTYEVTFDASGLTSGVYMYELQADNFVSVKKLLLMK